MTSYRKSVTELNQVLAALQTLSITNAAYDEKQWPKTRQIAELCDINIYLSRYYLMRLVKDKKAQVSSKSINNSLRWYIAESTLFYEISKERNPTESNPTYPDLIHLDILEIHSIRKMK